MAGPNNSAALMGSCWATPPHPARRDHPPPLPPLLSPNLSLSPCSPLSLNICGCRKQKHHGQNYCPEKNCPVTDYCFI